MTARAAGPRPTITVGFDQSEGSYAATQWAATEAKARGALLRIVTAWDPSPVTPWDFPDLTSWRNQAGSDAAAAAATARSAVGDGLDVEAVAIEGAPGRIMVAESRTSDVVVVGSAGHLGLVGLMQGSVSRQCLHRSTGPVVVVGPQADLEATRRLVVSSTLDPDGETFAWIREWLEQRPLPVHVIASYDFSAELPELALTSTQVRIRRAVSEQNQQWIWSLRNVIGDDVAVTDEVLQGRTLEVLRDHTTCGDLVVVPSGCEHFAPFARGGCPIVVVPERHHARPAEPARSGRLAAAID